MDSREPCRFLRCELAHLAPRGLPLNTCPTASYNVVTIVMLSLVASYLTIHIMICRITKMNFTVWHNILFAPAVLALNVVITPYQFALFAPLHPSPNLPQLSFRTSLRHYELIPWTLGTCNFKSSHLLHLCETSSVFSKLIL